MTTENKKATTRYAKPALWGLKELLYTAIRLARARFASQHHRRAARKVIIIAGSNYRETVYEDPSNVAKQFRSEGGIIITIEYLQGKEKSIPIYKKLASPNYRLITYVDRKQLRAQELRQLLCKANCFCKRRWVPYTIDQWDAPEGGCYLPVKISSTQRLATRTCKRKNGGILAVDEDKEKDAFLTKCKHSLFLTLCISCLVGDFTKWAKGRQTTENGDCVYMRRNGDHETEWFSDECDNDHFHICQTKPCDSTKYCPFQLSNDEREI
ncbi:unnamed protein product [Haemonchus placei]|uniref:C-type lectin domain-containing protein n=1 Tax=Haemonchus placei TaxID=6290 RepID=A0A0N4WQN5_HAEPC|nr:unnamed protein product [Haemonchus placei]